MPARKATTDAAAAVAHASLAEALFAIQQEMPTFQRDQINSHFGSSYANLETILPKVLEIIGKHGVMVQQFPSYLIAPNGLEVTPALRTVFTHVATGQEKEDVTPLMLGGKATAQSHASSVTYFRRYGIVSALGITTEKDDDGNAASGGVPAQTTQPAAVPAAVPGDGAAIGALPWQ